MKELGAGTLRKKALAREKSETAKDTSIELGARGINYRYTPMKREQLVRLATILGEQAGRRMSYTKTLDLALDALEREVKKAEKRRA